MDIEKLFYIITHSFMMKPLNNNNKKNPTKFPQPDIKVYEKQTLYLMMKNECYHLRSGCLLLSLIFKIVLEVLARVFMQQK